MGSSAGILSSRRTDLQFEAGKEEADQFDELGHVRSEFRF